jgi:hypothetical protein
MFLPPAPHDTIDPPPRCLGCAYILEHLEAPRCPECGRIFDPLNPATYTRVPGFVFWRYWLPAVLLAISGGFVIAYLFLASNALGWGLTLAVPFSIGAVIGYGVRGCAVSIAAFFLLSLVTVIVCLFMFNEVGVLCGTILSILFIVPMTVGVGTGKSLRHVLKDSSWDQRWHLPCILIFVLPALAHAAERWVGARIGPETVVTTAEVNAPLEAVWHAKILNAPSAQPSPTLMKLGLPRPTANDDHSSQIGQMKTIHFNKGQLAVRITERVENELLTFDYVEQNRIEDRAVKLLATSMQFAPISAGRCRVTLSTTYQPLMTPRWYWRPFERWSGETAHAFVINEMQREALAAPAPHPAVAWSN